VYLINATFVTSRNTTKVRALDVIVPPPIPRLNFLLPIVYQLTLDAALKFHGKSQIPAWSWKTPSQRLPFCLNRKKHSVGYDNVTLIPIVVKFFIFGIQIHIWIGSAHHESIRKVSWRTRNNFRILNWSWR
jgi:hypothetical protein